MSIAAEYDAYLSGFRHLAPHTRQRHIRWLHRWLLFLRARGEDVFQPSLESVGAFSEQVRRQYSVTSQWQATSVLRSFYEWLWLNGKTGGNPFRLVRRPKPINRARVILTEEEMLRLLAAFDGTRSSDIRDRAMVHFMYATLCRPGEVCELRMQQLDLARGGVIRYSAKTNREKWLPLYPAAIEAMNDWLTWGRPRYLRGRSSPFVFIGQAGRPQTTRNGRVVGVTTETLRQVIRRAAKRAGLDHNLTPYDIRHTAATHMIERGANLRYVQELLDHVDIRTTQIYTHVRPKALRAQYEMYHPLAAAGVGL